MVWRDSDQSPSQWGHLPRPYCVEQGLMDEWCRIIRSEVLCGEKLGDRSIHGSRYPTAPEASAGSNLTDNAISTMVTLFPGKASRCWATTPALSKEHSDTLNAARGFARLLRRMSQYEEAEHIFRQTLEALNPELENDHRTTV